LRVAVGDGESDADTEGDGEAEGNSEAEGNGNGDVVGYGAIAAGCDVAGVRELAVGVGSGGWIRVGTGVGVRVGASVGVGVGVGPCLWCVSNPPTRVAAPSASSVFVRPRDEPGASMAATWYRAKHGVMYLPEAIEF